MAVKTYPNGFKKKKMEKQQFSSSTALPNTDFVVHFVPKTRGYVNFIPTLDGGFFPFFLAVAATDGRVRSLCGVENLYSAQQGNDRIMQCLW